MIFMRDVALNQTRKILQPAQMGKTMFFFPFCSQGYERDTVTVVMCLQRLCCNEKARANQHHPGTILYCSSNSKKKDITKVKEEEGMLFQQLTQHKNAGSYLFTKVRSDCWTGLNEVK